MKYEDAEKRLVEIANGEYCHIRYERTHYSAACDGGVKQECNLYISNRANVTKSTWERAFLSLEAQLKGEKDPTLDFIDEAPEGELDAEEKTV